MRATACMGLQRINSQFSTSYFLPATCVLASKVPCSTCGCTSWISLWNTQRTILKGPL